jgi:CBS domain-containing protein
MAVKRSLRRSLAGWVDAFESWMTDVGADGSVQSTIAFDQRRVVGPLETDAVLEEVLRRAPAFPDFLRHMAFRALGARPPTGPFGRLAVEEKGEHAGRLDIKHGGILIVTSVARAYALAIGVTDKSTLERLAALETVGGFGSFAGDLAESFRFLWGIRLEHQARLARDGSEPDDHIDPADLGPVARRGLREAFGVIRRVQRLMTTALRYAAPPFSG